MADPGHHLRRPKRAHQQTGEISGDDETDAGRAEAFDLGANAEQRCEQSVAEQQQTVAEQQREYRQNGGQHSE